MKVVGNDESYTMVRLDFYFEQFLMIFGFLEKFLDLVSLSSFECLWCFGWEKHYRNVAHLDEGIISTGAFCHRPSSTFPVTFPARSTGVRLHHFCGSSRPQGRGKGVFSSIICRLSFIVGFYKIRISYICFVVPQVGH